MKFKKRIEWKSPSITTAIFKSAYFIGILLYILAIGQLFLTLSLPLEIRSDRFDVYARNVTSILSFAILGQFLITWCAFNVDALTKEWQVKMFKGLAIAGFALSVTKGLWSIYFVVCQFNRGLVVTSYYISDVVVWLAMALFYFAYWQLKISHHKRFSWFKVDFRKLTNVVVYFFVFKAAVSSYYTAIRYNHYGIAWTFFLYDAIAWLFLAAFFAAYTRSNLVGMKMTKGKKKDADLEALCDNVAKVKDRRKDDWVFYDEG